MCCQTRRRDDEELLHRTITYKIGPYVRGITLDTPVSSNYLNLPSKTKMLRNRFIQTNNAAYENHNSTQKSSQKTQLWGKGGGRQIATGSPTYFIIIYIHQETDRQENTFSLTNLWKGGKLPQTPPLIPSPIQFTNKTDQQGTISSLTNLSISLFLIVHIEKPYQTHSIPLILNTT
jgi:hypothetical protein